MCAAQVCLFDLDYGLPVQVRDQALGMQDESLPDSAVGKEFALQRMTAEGEFDESKFNAQAPNDLLQRLARTGPYYKVCLLQRLGQAVPVGPGGS
jgi:pre-mRNA-splicing factor RBM22/SLT11